MFCCSNTIGRVREIFCITSVSRKKVKFDLIKAVLHKDGMKVWHKSGILLFLHLKTVGYQFTHIAVCSICVCFILLKYFLCINLTLVSHLRSGAASGYHSHDEQKGRAGGTKHVCRDILLICCLQTHKQTQSFAHSH